jgi:hypothetical protein
MGEKNKIIRKFERNIRTLGKLEEKKTLFLIPLVLEDLPRIHEF